MIFKDTEEIRRLFLGLSVWFQIGSSVFLLSIGHVFVGFTSLELMALLDKMILPNQ